MVGFDCPKGAGTEKRLKRLTHAILLETPQFSQQLRKKGKQSNLWQCQSLLNDEGGLEVAAFEGSRSQLLFTVITVADNDI